MLAYFQLEDKGCRRSATNLLTKDEARHLSVNFAKLLRRRLSIIRSELRMRTASTRVWGETTGVVLSHWVHVYAKQTLQDQLAQWQIRSPIQLTQFGITIWDHSIERVRPALEVVVPPFTEWKASDNGPAPPATLASALTLN